VPAAELPAGVFTGQWVSAGDCAGGWSIPASDSLPTPRITAGDNLPRGRPGSNRLPLADSLQESPGQLQSSGAEGLCFIPAGSPTQDLLLTTAGSSKGLDTGQSILICH